MKTEKRLYIIDVLKQVLWIYKHQEMNEQKLLENLMRTYGISLRGAQACLKMAKGGSNGDIRKGRLGTSKGISRSNAQTSLNHTDY